MELFVYLYTLSAILAMTKLRLMLKVDGSQPLFLRFPKVGQSTLIGAYSFVCRLTTTHTKQHTNTNTHKHSHTHKHTLAGPH